MVIIQQTGRTTIHTDLATLHIAGTATWVTIHTWAWAAMVIHPTERAGRCRWALHSDTTRGFMAAWHTAMATFGTVHGQCMIPSTIRFIWACPACRALTVSTVTIAMGPMAIQDTTVIPAPGSWWIMA